MSPLLLIIIGLGVVLLLWITYGSHDATPSESAKGPLLEPHDVEQQCRLPASGLFKIRVFEQSGSLQQDEKLVTSRSEAIKAALSTFKRANIDLLTVKANDAKRLRLDRAVIDLNGRNHNRKVHGIEIECIQSDAPFNVQVSVQYTRPPETSSQYQTSPFEPQESKDAWEGNFYEVQNAFDVTARLKLNYVDGDGKPSERIVRVRQFGDYGQTGMMIGHCEMRDATRTFLTSRIRSCIDMETGEVIDDVYAYFKARYQASTQKSLDLLQDQHPDLLRCLFYVVKSDGQFRKNEKLVIAEYLKQLTGDTRMDLDSVEKTFQFMTVPSVQAFRLAAGRLSKQDESIKLGFIETLNQLYSLKKKINPAEQEAVDYLKRKLSCSPDVSNE